MGHWPWPSIIMVSVPADMLKTCLLIGELQIRDYIKKLLQKCRS